jgi:hypothetical protein
MGPSGFGVGSDTAAVPRQVQARPMMVTARAAAERRGIEREAKRLAQQAEKRARCVAAGASTQLIREVSKYAKAAAKLAAPLQDTHDELVAAKARRGR